MDGQAWVEGTELMSAVHSVDVVLESAQLRKTVAVVCHQIANQYQPQAEG